MKILIFILFIFVNLIAQDTTLVISNQIANLIFDTKNPSIEILSPNGLENFNSSELINVEWFAIDDYFSEQPISIYLSENIGNGFDLLLNNIENTNTTLVELPNINTNFAMMKITAVDYFGNQSDDTSDDYFIIGNSFGNNYSDSTLVISSLLSNLELDTKKPLINIISPSGGESFENNQLIDVEWIAEDDSFDDSDISIFLSQNIGSNFENILNQIPNSGLAQISLPEANSNYGMIKIDAVDKYGNANDDMLNDYFLIGSQNEFVFSDTTIIVDNFFNELIIDSKNPFIDLISPNGGENFDSGEDIFINWDAYDNSFTETPISIYIAREIGGFFEPLVENIPNGFGTIVDLPEDDRAFVRIKIIGEDSFGNTNEDASEGYFLLGDPFNEYSVNPYEDLIILDWGWGDYHNILVTHDALSFMDNGDEVHIVDENGIISDQCITSNNNAFYFGALTENSIEILYNSLIEMSGFQFDVNGDVNIIRGEGGDAGSAGFTIVSNGSTVLGFSVDGASIPPGSGVLTNLEVDYATFEACLNNAVISDNNEAGYDFDTGNCYDENYIIPSLEIYGAVSVAKQTYVESDDNPLNLYCVEGYDYCDDTNSIYPGYVKGNPVSMLHYDTSQDTFYELNPQFSSWSGNFGDTPQDTLTFKYYSASQNKTYTINETIPFTPSMIEGDAMFPVEYTFDENSFVEGEIECEFNPYDFEYWGAITSTVDNVEVGDQFATFVNGECRGINPAIESPFETTIFLLDVYGNAALSVISSFNRSRSAITDIDYQVSSSTRQDYNFNIYRDDSILESDIDEYYFIDETTEDGQSYCYTITLIDNQGNEALVSQNQCIDLGLDLGQLLGDINGDDILNILDIVTLVTIVISGGDNPAADINEDGILNILDIVVLVNLVLNT